MGFLTAKLNRRLAGFTLAELLIALAILGVIATFTIPKVLNSQQDQKRKTVFKETIAALNDLVYVGCLKGDVTEANLGTYLLNNLNYVRYCAVAKAAPNPCWVGYEFSSQGSEKGVVLHSGAAIAGFDDTVGSPSYGADTLMVDWDGPDAGTGTEGDDIIVLRAIINNSAITDRVCTVRRDAAAGTAASNTLWNEIFAN